jgi:3-oxoacyl-[acyl-carrier-protein] synthase II
MIRPRQATMEKVMRLSLADAQIDGKNIGYGSAHGTATDHGDIAETNATFNVLGSKPFSSIKSYTGHTLGACGAFELITSIKMMQEGWFAPTLNLENIDKDCADLDYICNQERDIKTNIIMSNNFAFGGINTSLIVRNNPDL